MCKSVSNLPRLSIAAISHQSELGNIFDEIVKIYP